MENWLLYFAKVNGLIVLFYVMYVLFLRKETFFKSNRLYLILGLISSFIFPLITFTKTVWVEPKPVIFDENINYNSVLVENTASIEETFNWNEVLLSVYLLISILVLIKITLEVVSFFKSIKNQDQTNEENYTLINSSQNANPFSFFNFIVINQQQFSEEELHHIVIHESIHVKQKHSFDVLFSRIICAILWINPVVWMYRKAIIQNLEFIADHETFLTINNKHAYQKTLLKVVINNNQSPITNQFFQSLIKKRIVMLNTNQSHKKKSWKYALILPVLVAFTLLFQIETVAQTKEIEAEEITYAVSSSYSSILTKNTSDRELKELEKSFSDENHKLTISNVKRNNDDEIITIKLEFDFGKTYNRVLERKSDKPIKDIKIYINSDEDDDLAYGFDEIDNVTLEVIEIDGLVKDITKSKNWSMDNMKKNGKEVVLIVNGKVKGAEEKVKMNFDEELGDMKEISAGEFEKKYNKKADKDKLYYEVETIKTVNMKSNRNKVLIGSYEKTDEDSKSSNSINKLYVINGKEYLKSELPKGATISLEGSITDLDKEEGIKRYGQKGKDGVLVFDGTAKFISPEGKSLQGYGASYEATEAPNHVKRIKENKNLDYKKAYIIYDGKEINYNELDNIDPSIISSLSTMKSSDYALKKYGEKGKNGVIVIESKNYYEKNNPNAKINKEYEVFNLKEKNEGFIITKNSKKEDLDFYKSTLAKSNIEFKYSGIKRNDKGEITSISINLKQKESKIKRNIKTSNPIPSLFIGMKKGSIVIEETN